MKQGWRSQRQMTLKQKVPAVLHSGCQDPLDLQGVMLGSRPCLNPLIHYIVLEFNRQFPFHPSQNVFTAVLQSYNP